MKKIKARHYSEWKARRKKIVVQIENWKSVRARVIERDGYKCRICSSDADESKLNVHHIEYDRTRNEDVDLVTLCSECHRAIHFEGYRPSLYEDWPAPWGEHPAT